MDPKDTKDAGEVKDKKEKKEVKDTQQVSEPKKSKTGWYYIALIIIIIILAIVGFVLQSQVSNLKKQINTLKNDNNNLASTVNGYSVQIDSLKAYNENLKSGDVPFWSDDGKSMIVSNIPLNSYSAKLLSVTAIAESFGNASENNLVFKSITNNGVNWIGIFSCSNAANDSSCGKKITIDETKKTYSITALA